MNRPLLAALLLTAALLTGCIGTSEAPEPVEPTEAPGNDAPSLVVEVVDPTPAPVPRADVTVTVEGRALAAETDATGLATFEQLPTGTARIDARAPGHHPRSLTVQLGSDQQVHQAITLVPVGEAEAFVETFEFQGFFECSATYLIITGDCLTLARAAAQEAGVEAGENATNERFTFPFPLYDGWTHLRITQTWEEPVAGLGSMMRVNLEPVDQNNTEGHGDRYARAEGSSPVVLEVERGQLHTGASSEEMRLPEEGGWVRTRTFHLGLSETHNPGGTEFLGLGASLQQHFTVIVEVTYGAGA